MNSTALNKTIALDRNCLEEYQQKLCTPAEAASAVQNGEFLVFPICAGEPILFTKALAARQQSLEGVTINQQHHVCPDYFTEESAKHIKVNSFSVAASAFSPKSSNPFLRLY